MINIWCKNYFDTEFQHSAHLCYYSPIFSFLRNILYCLQRVKVVLDTNVKNVVIGVQVSEHNGISYYSLIHACFECFCCFVGAVAKLTIEESVANKRTTL
jgi:hypothetical protein